MERIEVGFPGTIQCHQSTVISAKVTIDPSGLAHWSSEVTAATHKSHFIPGDP